MGKTKRNRTKYHFSSVKSDVTNTLPVESKLSVNNISECSKEVSKNTAERIEDTIELESDISKPKSDPNEGWKVVPADDLFKNVDINVDKLETKVPIEDHVDDSDDRKPNMMSVSKLIKRFVTGSGKNIHLRKGDKRELRRHLFIKKIDAFHEGFFKKKQKKAKGINKSEADEKKSKWENSLDKNVLKVSKLPKVPKSINQLSDSNSGKISKRKQKSMAKLKSKREEMLNNIEFFNQIMSDSKYRSDAMGVVTDAIQKQVYTDL